MPAAASPVILKMFINRALLYKILTAYTLIVDDTSDGLGKHIGNGYLLNLGTTVGVGNRVGEYYLLERLVLNAFACRTAHHAV